MTVSREESWGTERSSDCGYERNRKKGNISKILVTRDGDTLVNIPLTVGVLGNRGCAMGYDCRYCGGVWFLKCKIEFVKEDGSVIDLTEKAGDFYEDAKEKGS